MDIMVILVTLFVLLYFLKRRSGQPTIEEILHLVSTDELKIAQIMLAHVRQDPLSIEHFILHGRKMICGYGLHKMVVENEIMGVPVELIEIMIHQSQSGITIHFESGQPTEWKIIREKEFRCPLNGHERWVLKQILATIQNAVATETQGALS